MWMQIRSDVLRLLLSFGAAFLTAILLRAMFWGSNITQGLAPAFVIALSIALGLTWIEHPRHR